MKSLVTSSDDNTSDQESNMDKYAIYSKDKVYELKNSGYMKKKIISAIKKSLKTNNNKHSLTLNDVSVSEEKEIGNGCRQSLNIRIALDDKLYFSSGDPGVAPINIETFKLNDSTPETKCCSHCSGSKEVRSDDWTAYFSCVKCGRKEKRKWYHENCKEKCCTETSIHCDNCLRFKLTSIDHNFEVLSNKFAKYMYVVTCPNGGGISLHMDYERIMHFTEDEQKVIAKEFLKEAFKEDKKGFAQFTIAIVHNGASYMPDLLKLLAELHPTLPVKTTKLKCNTETEVMDLGTYYTKVKETYSNGTFAFNPLNEIQAASVKNDECGAYLPELLSLLEKSAFLTLVLPWSDMTTKRFKTPHESDDGPIFWCRPGEQIVSLDRNSKRNRWNADEIESFLKERQQNLKYFCEKRYIVEELKKYRRSYSSREVLFEDRTRPHADQVWGNHFECTAAVGVIQAIHPDEIPEQNRACKEIVVFHAKHFEMLEALLHIDVTAAPKQQCAEWLDDAKLNMIRQMNIRYSKLHLYDNDIYFIPRKIVHQFKTVSATLSVAWHTRLIEYYLEPDPPPVSETAEGSEIASSTAPIKGEQVSDDDDASSSCSSDSLPPPVATPKKSTTVTPKKKRKLSCTRSTASTDNEATPRKKKKPRSRSGTPQKRAPVTPKKRQQKTPKKVLILDEADDEDEKPAPQQLQKRTPSPDVRLPPAQAPIPQPKELSSSSRSSSPVASKSTKKKSRSRSPPPPKKCENEQPKEVRSSSRSASPVSRKSNKKKSRSRSPTNKRDNDQPKESCSLSRSSSPLAAKSMKKKSRSQSPPPVKKRSSDETANGEPSKKKKRKSRSRSRSRKHSDTNLIDKDRKTDSSEGGKSSSKKKKKDRSRSRSPRKSGKSKDTASDTALSSKNDTFGTSSKSSKKSKKHDDDHSKSSTNEKERKKHRSDKDHRSRSDSHRSDSSPKRRDSDKISPATSGESSSTSSATVKEPKTVDVESQQKSPTVESMSTDRCPTPTVDLPTADDTTVAVETEFENSPVTVDEALATTSSTTSCSPTEPVVENTSSPSPVQEPEPETAQLVAIDEPTPVAIDEPTPVVKRPATPPASPPHTEDIKQEPDSTSLPENEPVKVDHEVPIKSEPLDNVATSITTTIKEEPGALTAAEVKNTSTSVPAAPTKLVPEKSVKKTGAGVDSTTLTGKDHRKKEKLWDTPLFMPQDCDKYEWTKRSSAPPVVSNRVSTKNGDKIVKEKTLNSLQHIHKVDDGKNNSATAAPAKSSRSRSKSPPPWIKKREKKADENNKLSVSAEVKKSSSNSDDKRGSVAIVDREKPSSTSSSSDKHRSDKEKKSSDHRRNKGTNGKKDAEKSDARSSTTSEKKKSSSSSHTKDTGAKSSLTSSKDHSHEKRKRSRSPQPEKHHRDKHSSSLSKKHKKHRSRSRDGTEPSTDKNKPSGSTSIPNVASSTVSSTEAASLQNAQDAELAANFKLMIPRVQIVDIGAKYKSGGMRSSPKVSEDSEPASADNDVAEAATINAADGDQNMPSEMSDHSPTEVHETAATTKADIQRDE